MLEDTIRNAAASESSEEQRWLPVVFSDTKTRIQTFIDAAYSQDASNRGVLRLRERFYTRNAMVSSLGNASEYVRYNSFKTYGSWDMDKAAVLAKHGFYCASTTSAYCFSCGNSWSTVNDVSTCAFTHSSSCGFKNNTQYNNNIPLDVTMSSQPAKQIAVTADIVAAGNVSGEYIFTAARDGQIVIWNARFQVVERGRVRTTEFFQTLASTRQRRNMKASKAGTNGGSGSGAAGTSSGGAFGAAAGTGEEDPELAAAIAASLQVCLSFFPSFFL